MSSPEDSGRGKKPPPAPPPESMSIPDTDPGKSRSIESAGQGERTNIDNELGRRLQEKYAAELPVEPTPPSAEPIILGRKHPDAELITAEVVEASAEIAAEPAPAPQPVNALPEPESSEPNISAALADPAVKAEPAVVLPRPQDVPTSTRPVGPGVSDARLQRVRGSAKIETDDGWAGFQESGVEWKSLTGESQVASKPPSPAASGPQYSRRDTNVYKVGKAAASKEEGGARLVGIGGADQGREFSIFEQEMSVGRGTGNNVVLNDSSVSREHARLVHEGDGYVIVDLRSANGTFVNGQKVDRAKVQSGDEIAFGNTRFRFLEIGDVFKPVDASGAPVLPGARQSSWRQLRASPHFKSLAISAAILLFTVGVTVVVLVARSGSTGGRSRREAIFQYYLQGVEAFKRRQWPDAEAQFSIILGLEPTHARGQRYMQEASREKALEGQLAAARASRQTGDLAQAYAQAAGITDSVYTPEATEIVRAIDAELDIRVTRARSALEASQPLEALKLLDTVETVRPGRPDVAALRDRSRMGIDGGAPSKSSEGAPPEPVRTEPAPKRPPTRPVDEDHKPTARTPSNDDNRDEGKATGRKPAAAFGPGVIGKATAAFASGDIVGALKALDGAGDNRDVQVLRAKIEKFQKVYEGAKEEHRAKRAETAIKELKQAKAFEAKITGGDSDLAEEIDRKIADMYYVLGINNYLGKSYADAFKDFKTALSFDSTHRPSQKKVEDLADKAKEIYEEGYRLMETDSAKARDRFKTVLQIVPTGSDYYKKAKERLESLP